MRILHIADSHLGFAAYSALTRDGLNQREDDLQRAFSWAVDRAIGEGVGAVVHSGDLFDSIRPSNRAIRFAMDELKRLSDAGIDFIVVSGNHDTPRMRTTGSVLRLLEHNPRVHAFYGLSPGRARLGDAAFTCLGHVPDAEAYARALAACSPDKDAESNVLVLHVGVGGVSVFRTAEFSETVVPLGSLPSGFDYTALGHYHGQVEVAPGVWYAGSLERLTFSEADDLKGARLVDLPSGDARLVPYAARPMVRLTLDAAGMSASEVADGCSNLAERAGDGAVVSLSVSNLDAPVRRALDLRAIRSGFDHTLHLALRLISAEGVPEPGTMRSEGGLADELAAYARSVGAAQVAAERARRFLEEAE